MSDVMARLFTAKDLDASRDWFCLGATWIDKRYIQRFMYETLCRLSQQRSIEVNYSSYR